MQLSLLSLTTSISNSFQPDTDFSIKIWFVGLAFNPLVTNFLNSFSVYATPPPVPPRVKLGLITKGNLSLFFTLIETSGSFNYIDWKEVSVKIGEGPISLSKSVTEKFVEYLEIYENNKNEKGWSIYFSVSSDGKNSGDMESSSSGAKNIEMVKAMAIVECMDNNKKNKCYLYAINDEVVWK